MSTQDAQHIVYDDIRNAKIKEFVETQGGVCLVESSHELIGYLANRGMNYQILEHVYLNNHSNDIEYSSYLPLCRLAQELDEQCSGNSHKIMGVLSPNTNNDSTLRQTCRLFEHSLIYAFSPSLDQRRANIDSAEYVTEVNRVERHNMNLNCHFNSFITEMMSITMRFKQQANCHFIIPIHDVLFLDSNMLSKFLLITKRLKHKNITFIVDDISKEEICHKLLADSNMSERQGFVSLRYKMTEKLTDHITEI